MTTIDKFWDRAPFRAMVSVDLLKQHRPEAEVIVRMGVVANALIALTRYERNDDSSLIELLTGLQRVTLMASYARETAKIMNRRHGGLAWRLAEDGIAAGHRLTHADLTTLRATLQVGNAFFDACSKIRDEHGFHVDADPALSWINDAGRLEEVTLQTIDESGWRCDIAGQVLHTALPTEFEGVWFYDQLLAFMRAIPLVVEAMIAGFCVRYSPVIQMMDSIKSDDCDLETVPTSTGNVAVRVRPKKMTWFPFFVAVPMTDADRLSPQLCVDPMDGTPVRDIGKRPEREYPGWWVRFSDRPVSPDGEVICLLCKETPGPLCFGRPEGPRYRVVLSRMWKPEPGGSQLILPDVTN